MSAPLSLASLSDEQLEAVFDFLPLLQHTLKQVAHVSEASPASSAPPINAAQMDQLLREQQRRASVQEGVRVLVKLDPWDSNQLHLWLQPNEFVATVRMLVEAHRRARTELLPFDLQLVTEPKRLYAPGEDAVTLASVLATAAAYTTRPAEQKNILEFAVRNQPQPQNAAALQAATAALIRRVTCARDLLHLLPNIDVSQSEQEEESRRLDIILQRKRALLDALRIQRQAPQPPPQAPASLQ